MSERDTAVWQEEEPRCRHLRSKAYYMDLPVHASGIEHGIEVPCWCARTNKPFGPDADRATGGGCTRERSCFEAA